MIIDIRCDPSLYITERGKYAGKIIKKPIYNSCIKIIGILEDNTIINDYIQYVDTDRKFIIVRKFKLIYTFDGIEKYDCKQIFIQIYDMPYDEQNLLLEFM